MTGSPNLLTTQQVAAMLKVSSRTVTNWVRADRVPYVRLPGGEYRIPEAGLLNSLSGTYDIRGTPGDLDLGTRVRQAADGDSMSARLARVHSLSKQMTAIAGQARSR